jgi:DNA-binding HxlR family transcriptional regulator
MSRRRYKQNCALALANDVVGERWTLLLIRDLLIFPRRFKDLLASLKGMGTNLLASRLKDLEAQDIVERRQGEGGSMVYALTPRGRALEPAVLELIRWGFRHGPAHEEGDHHRDDWDLLALKALFQEGLAGGLSVCAQFDGGDSPGWVRIADRGIKIGLGSEDKADIRIAGTVADLFIRSDNPGRLLTRGNPELLQGFMSSFGERQ